jgi:hypothetical protein
MNIPNFTAALAERVMRWEVRPDRFLTGERRWMPRWRFQPTLKIEDAFRLLEGALPEQFTFCGDDKGNFEATVRVTGIVGQATGSSKPLTISCAVARAFGIAIEELYEV